MTGARQHLPSPIRLLNVPGFEGRTNDIVYCRPLKDVDRPTATVFFGGDVQDFTENMLSHRDNKNYQIWNLENTAQLLQLNFIDSHIIVIRPSRMEYKTFSCYENFVPCNKCGVPDHTPTHNGLIHLEKLLSNVSEQLQKMTDEELNAALELTKRALISGIQTECPENLQTVQLNDGNNSEITSLRKSTNLGNCDVKLVGFSKGCVVLNQFLYEFHYCKTLIPKDSDLLKIISKIRDMYWLDGGHSGGKNTWITSRSLLETLTGLGIRIHVHVTPYQINDDRRPWIRKEEKLFSDTLQKQGAFVDRFVHFENVNADLQLHFAVLKEFRKRAYPSSSVQL